MSLIEHIPILKNFVGNRYPIETVNFEDRANGFEPTKDFARRKDEKGMYFYEFKKNKIISKARDYATIYTGRAWDLMMFYSPNPSVRIPMRVCKPGEKVLLDDVAPATDERGNTLYLMEPIIDPVTRQPAYDATGKPLMRPQLDALQKPIPLLKQTQRVYDVPTIESIDEDMRFWYVQWIQSLNSIFPTQKLWEKYATQITLVILAGIFIIGYVYTTQNITQAVAPIASSLKDAAIEFHNATSIMAQNNDVLKEGIQAVVKLIPK